MQGPKKLITHSARFEVYLRYHIPELSRKPWTIVLVVVHIGFCMTLPVDVSCSMLFFV